MRGICLPRAAGFLDYVGGFGSPSIHPPCLQFCTELTCPAPRPHAHPAPCQVRP